MTYIYIIENVINQRVYIGKTSRDINIRLKEHINDAKRKKGYSSSITKCY